MKRVFTLMSIMLLAFLTTTNAQVVIESFDTAVADSAFVINDEGTEDSAVLTDVDGTLHVKAVVGSFNSWGSYIHLEKQVDSATYVNWLPYDTLSLMVKVDEAPVNANNMVMRMHIQDRLGFTDEDLAEEYIFEHTTIFDEVTDGFVELKIPLIDRDLDGQGNPDNTGFTHVPLSWYDASNNNNQIDWDKIVYWTITFVTATADADSMVVSFDDLKSIGARKIPHVFFNGKSLNSAMEYFQWGSSISIEEGAGATESTHALKWVQSDGWSGAGWNIDPAFDMASVWETDSIKFKMKAPAGTPAIRLQWEDGTDKVGLSFEPTGDDQWHQYAFKLNEIPFQDGSTTFNSANVTVFQMMAEGNGQSGRTIYLDDIWSGNPSFDIVAPIAPTLVTATAGDYSNLVTWADVPGESEEVYNLYASINPITDLTADYVWKVGVNIAEGTQQYNHTIFSPTEDQTLDYYYALVCVDAAGNESVLSDNASVNNVTKGVTVIHPTAPAGFAADGDLSEWASITPFRIFPDDGSGAVVTNTTIDSDADCSALAYLAVDESYLYVAFDVEDDIINTTHNNSWERDSPDLFIGLYNYLNGGHTSYRRGAEPDYHIRFNDDNMFFDAPGGATIDSVESEFYAWETQFPTGYHVEARIPWTAFADAGDDHLFVPKERMMIPIDLSISDSDDDNGRQGELTYSKLNEGQSYAGVDRWAVTWIGDGFIVSVDDEEEMPTEYSLEQNYPNPFNPSTQIKYTVTENAMVTLKVFNMLGQEVATLVNENKQAGTHQVNFDASQLSSGVYIYQIRTNNFISTRKMMLLK